MGKFRLAIYKGHIECWAKRQGKRRKGEKRRRGEESGGEKRWRRGELVWFAFLKFTLILPSHLCAEVFWLKKLKLSPFDESE
jgi:hypothetical protein